MKTLVATIALLGSLIVPASAGTLSANAEAGCKLVNDMMRPLMMVGDTELFDCNKGQKGYTHMAKRRQVHGLCCDGMENARWPPLSQQVAAEGLRDNSTGLRDASARYQPRRI